MAFQYSGRKDDVSMKLRAQNITNATRETRNLERDSEKMEERLRELKLAMVQEKEQRQRAGQGGFWSRGQEGNLGDYATDVLNKPAKTKSGKKKVKVLKDEPTVQPVRPSGPGTLGYIAKRSTAPGSAKEKMKGPKCGQCEEKAAHVSCQECGEFYCAGCFAAFHLKGALKKHRSVPVGASGMRTPRGGVVGGDMRGLTPRSRQTHSQDIMRPMPTDVEILPGSDSAASTPMGSARSISGHTSSSGNNLLDGDYDEREAAAEFQRALAEWRLGKKPDANGATSSSASPKQQRQASATKSRVQFAPTNQQAPGPSVEEGTGMEGFDVFSQQQIDIKFHSNLTYAEKLMLKRARRTELGPAPGSDASIPSGSRTGSSQGGTRVSPEPFVMSFSEVEVLDGGAMAMADLLDSERGERVDFSSLLGAVKRPQESSTVADEYEEAPSRSESRVSIIELQDNAPRRSMRGLPQSSSYQVVEVTDGDPFTPPAPSSLAKDHAGLYQEEHVMYSSKPKSASKTPVTSQVYENQNGVTPRQSNPAPKSARKSARKPANHDVDLDLTTNQSAQPSARQSARQNSSRKTPRQAPPSARMTSARGEKSRPASRSARPQSRAQSRADSRASLYGEGNITKEPSEALKQIAMLSREITSQILIDTTHRFDLGDFLTAGIDDTPRDPNEERTLTPTRNRPTTARSRPSSARPLSARPMSARGKDGQIERYKVSNKLYTMAPRSWKPDFSLADTVPDAQAQSFVTAEVAPLDNDVTSQVIDDADLAEQVALVSVQRLKASVDIPVEASINASFDTSLNASMNKRPHTPMSSRPSSRGRWEPAQPLRPPSRGHVTPRRPISARRENTQIVMDGEDLSKYDARGEETEQTQDDTNTLDQLEWELASETGRLTADGRVSRMLDDVTDDGDQSASPAEMLQQQRKDQGFDINNHLRESELMEDFEEMEKAINDEYDVQQLH